MISLVGITGPARHGKDTVGNMIMKHMPASTRFAFADKIKSFLVACMDAGESMLENKEGELCFLTSREDVQTAMMNELHLACMEYGVESADSFIRVLRAFHPSFHELSDGRIVFVSSWRKLFQMTGTDWGRQEVNEAFWIDPYLPHSDAVVTDVRGHGDTKEHRNIEATSIIDKGGVVIRVVDPRKGSIVRDHASEAGIEEQFITHTILNDGSLEELEDKVNNFIYTYLLKGEQ